MPHLKKNQILHSRFSLEEMIGAGGMGQVWRVWDLELEDQVAIKILNPQLTANPDSVDLLKNECRNTRRLVHPNIVRVFDFHRFKDLAFISMEYIDGRDLATHRSQFEHIRPAEIIKLIAPVIDALGYAHDLGLVHRDVKASNILLDRHKTPRLTDFGIAGVFKSGHNALDITSGGSLFCMSPQQLEGRQPSPSDDIYALGALLYELLSGYPPFYPDISRDKILHEIPAAINQKLDPTAVDANIPQPMEKLIEQMLAKMPAERPASMQEINDRLKHIVNRQVHQTLPPDVNNAGPPEDEPALSPAQIITPVRVTPGAARKGLPLSARSKRVKALALAATFVFLVAGGLWLWQYLASSPPGGPQVQQTLSEQNQAVPKKTPEVPAVLPEKAPDPARLAAEKEQAEQKLADFMQIKQTLEAKGVSQWGNAAYRQMTQLSEEADRFLIENDYIAAAAKYEAAAAQAQVLADRVDPTLEQLLDEGRLALNQGNAELARQKFNVALMIDPNNALAQKSLQRAQKIDAVRRLMESGSRHEKNGNISFAHADYQEALQLDPASKEARQALARVKGQIRDGEFQALMSEGLTALHNNNYKLARTKLLKAKSFRPQSREVKDALAQVDQSIRLANIETYRQKAIAAEQAENWEQALNAYQQALKIDSNVQFAARGKQRSLKFIRIDKRINFFLKQPAALESDRQLDNAIQLIAEIEKIEPKGPRLKDQFDKLTRLAAAAQTPVKIILESDNFTEVAVYKVGKLGRFASQELSLRPGTYTVVGTRDGYQDVRQKIIIKPGQGPVRIAVKCEVEI
jgi:serine/threonine protein kinase/Flp pilus assembly protein TadD